MDNIQCLKDRWEGPMGPDGPVSAVYLSLRTGEIIAVKQSECVYKQHEGAMARHVNG